MPKEEALCRAAVALSVQNQKLMDLVVKSGIAMEVPPLPAQPQTKTQLWGDSWECHDCKSFFPVTATGYVVHGDADGKRWALCGKCLEKRR